MKRASTRRQAGFTLVELITLMIIVSVLASIAQPRFFSANPFQATGFANEVRAGLRHAQALAMASGCDTRAELTATAFVVQRWNGGASCNDHSGTLATVTRPGGGAYSSGVPGSVAASGGAVFFDSLGRPWNANTGVMLASALVWSIDTQQVTINPETGLVQ